MTKSGHVAMALVLLALVVPVKADETQEYLRERLEQLQFVDQTAAGDLAIAAPAVLYNLYQGRNLQLIWDDERRDDLRRMIERAPEHGLDPEDYHYAEIMAQPTLAGLGPQARVNADLLLSEALLRVGYHARFGKVDPATLDANFNYGRSTGGPRPPSRRSRLILAADNLDEGLGVVIDPGPAYRGLVTVLARYRAMAEAGEWEVVPEGPTLRVGDDDPRVALLRRRLAHEGFLAHSDTPNVFDEELETQVQAIQRRYAHRQGWRGGSGNVARHQRQPCGAH